MAAVQELTEQEELALVALLRVVVQADHQISGQEHQEVRRLATTMGPQRFAQRVQQAQQELSSLAEIKAYALTIERQRARDIIFAFLLGLALRDGLSSEEESFLGWLHDSWNIDKANLPEG